METGRSEPDVRLFFNLTTGLCWTCRFAPSGLSPPIGATNCEFCLSLVSKVTNSNRTEFICIFLIFSEVAHGVGCVC